MKILCVYQAFFNRTVEKKKKKKIGYSPSFFLLLLFAMIIKTEIFEISDSFAMWDSFGIRCQI